MTAHLTVTESRDRSIEPPGKPRWGWPQYLAVAGTPILILEAWTLITWLADGPHQLTDYRRPGHPVDWWGARTFEVIAVIMSFFIIRRLIRGCRAQHRFLTFEVMFCLCGASIIWATTNVNFFVPMFTYNAYFLNVNDPCGHIPVIVNPDCGRMPSPILFGWLWETFGLLVSALALGWVVNRVKRRRPSLSTARVWVILIGGSALIVGVLEPLVIIPLHLWTYPGAPASIHIGGAAWRYPILTELPSFTCWLALTAALWYFSDDRGRTIVERGLDCYGPVKRRIVTLLSLYCLVQLISWGPSVAPDWAMGFFQDKWAKLPPELNNGLCNQPGVAAHTRYGPCPGSPGFRLPLPGSLRNESP